MGTIEGFKETLCPDCGPDIIVDEDLLCTQCGATAAGPYTDEIMCKLRTLETENERLRGLITHKQDSKEIELLTKKWNEAEHEIISLKAELEKVKGLVAGAYFGGYAAGAMGKFTCASAAWKESRFKEEIE